MHASTLPRRETEAHRIHPHTSHSIVPVLEKRSPTINSLVSARVPDVLEEAVPLGEAVHAVVALAHGADKAAKSVDLVLASVTAVLVNLGDGDLDRAVVLGLDDAVGRAALAGDVPAQRKNHGLVKGYVLSFFHSLLDSGGLVLVLVLVRGKKAFVGVAVGFSGGRLQVDKLAAVVLHFDGFGGW